MTLRILAGQFKGHLLKTPKGVQTRPTQSNVRAAVFNICQHRIQGARFLDLFAGSGAMGLEALSRDAAHAAFIENHPQAMRCIRENIQKLHLESRTELHRSIKSLSSLFDITYLDPPYETPIAPLIEKILPLLAPEALLFVEERSTNPSPTFPKLLHIDTRRFGAALLHQYQFSSTRKL